MFTLSVTLVKATNLPVSDFGFLGIGGKSDPYFTFKVAGRVQTSSMIKSNLNPIWKPNETFNFNIENPKASCLEVQAFDYDRLKANDLLGSACIALAPFLENKEHSEIIAYELDVQPEYQNQKCRAIVYLEVKLSSHGNADQVLELWENQRYHLIKRWTHETFLPNERKRWSSVSNSSISSMNFGDVAPTVPSGMSGEGWLYDVSKGDAEGWLYAPSFQGPWHRDAGPLALVRRRKWINKCKIDPASNNQQNHL